MKRNLLVALATFLFLPGGCLGLVGCATFRTHTALYSTEAARASDNDYTAPGDIFDVRFQFDGEAAFDATTRGVEKVVKAVTSIVPGP